MLKTQLSQRIGKKIQGQSISSHGRFLVRDYIHKFCFDND